MVFSTATLLTTLLLFESELHDCEVFEGDCQVTQCFRCLEYGHIAKRCKNLTKCGFCANIGHLSQDCLKKEDRSSHHCALCRRRGANHTAWAKECPIRKEKTEEARKAYLLRPTRFQERTRTTTKTTTTQAQNQSQGESQPTPTTTQEPTTTLYHLEDENTDPTQEIGERDLPFTRSGSQRSLRPRRQKRRCTQSIAPSESTI